MRRYIGTIESGRPMVRIIEREAGPGLDEVGVFLDQVLAANSEATFGAERQAALLRRKHDVLDRITASEKPARISLLPHLVRHSPAGVSWGDSGAGSTDLARSLLAAEFEALPPLDVYMAFRDRVVSQLAPDGFMLRDEDIRLWAGEAFPELYAMPTSAQAASAEVNEGATIQEASASALVAACESAWDAIQAEHPLVPDAVIVLGSGVEHGRLVKLGHWWAGRWMADGQVRGEVLLAGEALHLAPEAVFEVLLHEAAHGLNAARIVKDTSRGGRYHNTRFRETADELGLAASQMRPYGWARTSLTRAAAERYAGPIAALGDAMRIARQLDRNVEIGVGGRERDLDRGREAEQDREGAQGASNDRNGAAACRCGRKMRMSPSVLAAGPVFCGICSTEFEPARRAERAGTAEPAVIVNRSFVKRRREAVEAEAAREAAERLAGQTSTLGRLLEEADPSTPAIVALALRRNGVGQVARSAGVAAPMATEEVHLTDVQMAGITDVLAGGAHPGDEVVVEWYRTFATMDEQPMVVAGEADAERLASMARAMLKADGTLIGPEVSLGDLRLMAGDRVFVGFDAPVGGFPTGGMVGRVEQVDPVTSMAEIDFCFDGTITLGPDSQEATWLRYDYTVPAHEVYVDVRSVQPAAAIEREVRRLPELELP